MKLKQRGQYYELPIFGARIPKFVFDGLIQIGFDNDGNDKLLDIHGEFKFIKHNQETIYNPGDSNTWRQLIDLWYNEVKDALADHSGNLFITFNNEIEMIINDGSYETWHFTMIDQENRNNNLVVHGGVGRTVW